MPMGTDTQAINTQLTELGTKAAGVRGGEGGEGMLSNQSKAQDPAMPVGKETEAIKHKAPKYDQEATQPMGICQHTS